MKSSISPALKKARTSLAIFSFLVLLGTYLPVSANIQTAAAYSTNNIELIKSKKHRRPTSGAYCVRNFNDFVIDDIPNHPNLRRDVLRNRRQEVHSCTTRFHYNGPSYGWYPNGLDDGYDGYSDYNGYGDYDSYGGYGGYGEGYWY